MFMVLCENIYCDGQIQILVYSMKRRRRWLGIKQKRKEETNRRAGSKEVRASNAAFRKKISKCFFVCRSSKRKENA